MQEMKKGGVFFVVKNEESGEKKEVDVRHIVGSKGKGETKEKKE